MSRFRKRVLVGLVAIVILLPVTAWVTLTWILTRPATYRPTVEVGPIVLRSWPDHDAIYNTTAFPYRLSLENETGALEYVGALHTSDAQHPQLKEIESLWAAFQPTVALCEGRKRMNQFAARPQTGRLSESDLTRILARQSSVKLYSLEPSYETEVAELLKRFDPELVATYLTLRVYSAEAEQAGDNLDALAQHLLNKRTNVEGLRDTFNRLADLDDYWSRAFPDQPDWRTLRDTERVAALREVGDASRQVRGEHMVRTIVELVRNGERVFAVVGASHVIRQEPVLQTLLDTPGTPSSLPGR